MNKTYIFEATNKDTNEVSYIKAVNKKAATIIATIPSVGYNIPTNFTIKKICKVD